jgi:HEXXH motif-containing protein
VNLPSHYVSREMFAALASGGGGDDAMRALAAAEYSKHAILLRGVLIAARGTEQYSLARAGYDLVSAAWRRNRAAAERVIKHPSVGAWARRTIEACRGGPAMPGAEPGGLRAVGAAAAIQSGLSAEIEIPAAGGRAMLPSLGAAVVLGSAALVRSGSGYVTVGQVTVPRDPYRDAPGWLGLHRVRAGSLDVLVDDVDPFRMPDVPYLGPRVSTPLWEVALGHTWLVVEQGHPVTAAEIAASVSVIVPRSRPPASSVAAVSATAPEAFGAIALSLPTDPIAGAETLAHEMQHLKLGAVQDIITLTLPDDGRRYYAPWRDDPRPLGGLLQGTYAFLGVAGFWRRQRQLPQDHLRADVEYARWRSTSLVAAETLQSSGRLTSAGLDFVGGMIRTLRAWQAEPVSALAVTEARSAAESHLARWQSSNGQH